MSAFHIAWRGHLVAGDVARADEERLCAVAGTGDHDEVDRVSGFESQLRFVRAEVKSKAYQSEQLGCTQAD